MSTLLTRPPAMAFLPLAEIDWSNAAALIRFRSDTRPSELLHQGLILRRFGRRVVALVADPAAATAILVTKAASFPKAELQARLGRAAFGAGMSGCSAEANARQRKAFQPLFRAPNTTGIAALARLVAEEAAERWLEAGSIDLHFEMRALALQIAWDTLLGDNLYRGRDPLIAEIVRRNLEMPHEDMVGPASLYRELAALLEHSGRHATLRDNNPLKHIACPAGGSGLSQAELRANAAVLAASGHATTGLTLAWALWLMAGAPDLQDEIANGGAAHENRGALWQLLNETLRLFPPGTEVMRDAKVALPVGEHDIPVGALVLVSIYGLHRHRRLWSDPDGFDPGRFSTARAADLPEGGFFPFSGGAFGCAGQAVAWSEMRAIASVLSERLVLTRDETEAADVGLVAGGCLFPDHPLRVQVRRRSGP